jgi:sugar/nucleoside kinase (ribokinase family)
MPEPIASTPVIALIGDVMVDIVATLSGEIRRGTDTASHNSMSGGGASANTAAWLGWSGETAVMIGAVGGDAFGETAGAQLERFGVECALQRVSDTPTGSVIALVHPDGERTMFPDAGANLLLSPDHVESVLRELAGQGGDVHLHVSGYTLMREPTRAAAQHGLAIARALGITTSIDPASTGPMQDVGLDVVRELFADVDLLIANDDEAGVLSGESEMGAASQALTQLAPHVIVKCGADGARWADRNKSTVKVSTPQTRVLDTLGAGDAFAAGALPAWKRGATPSEILHAGGRIAAECVALSGARPVRPRS